jgi:cobalt-zinc-cadmium efflux system outer membrane protein
MRLISFSFLWYFLAAIGAVFFLLNDGWAQSSGPSLPVESLTQLALQRNRELQATQQRIVEQQGFLTQARVRPFSVLAVSGTPGGLSGSPGTDEFQAEFSYTLETAGKRDKRIAVAQQMLNQAEAELANQTRLLLYDVKSRYAVAVAEQYKLETFERLLTINRHDYQIAEARAQEGDLAPLAQQLLLTDLNRVDAQRATSVGKVTSAASLLRQTIGILPGEEAISWQKDMTAPSRELDLERLQEQAVLKRPDLKLLQFRGEQADREFALALAEGTPNLQPFIRYSWSRNQFDQFGLTGNRQLSRIHEKDHLFTFGVSIPLFTAQRTEGLQMAAQARGAEVRLRRQHLETVVRAEVLAAFQRWLTTRNAIDIFKQGVLQQSEQNLATIREAFRLGQLPVSDVLVEQRRLLDTQLAFIDASADHFLAFAELERAVGEPLL